MPRFAILAGFLCGILAALLVMGGIYALAPESPTGVPAATPAPAGSSAADGVEPVASVVASPLGEPALALVVPQVGGGTIDLANFKGKPVWVNFMAAAFPLGLDANGANATAWDALVLPGVTVTP